MGLPSDYPLPVRYQHAFQLMGDGVVAPVVSFIARTIIERIVTAPAEPAARRDEDAAGRLPA
ncbi:hypothetical protein [Sphingomonas sp. LR60]|uniref:hypothetical protein n=1 Tax=Sphingomonas sp. LR60 TaxID=3050233 RepID=UPI003FA6D192